MKSRHVQEMSCWQPRRVDPDAASFVRGLAVGVPLGVALWTLILAWVL